MIDGTHATLLAATLTLAASAFGQQIDVSTLPPREGVQLTIYNSEDLTLVRERRSVTVAKGQNELQFSWANTLIDPTSVEIEFPAAKAGALDVIDTRYPFDRPQALYWNVRSDFDGEALVEISYFTSGISWSADYVGVTTDDEASMTFDGYVTISNNSGADYSDAQVRMVVGTVNLVETIRDLATRHLPPPPAASGGGRPGKRGPSDPGAVRREAVRYKMRSLNGPGGAGGLSDMDGDGAPPEIVKEGLSEYFIFTVAGTHDVKNGWANRLRLFEGTKVPVRTVYRYRPMEYGDQLVKLFLVKNDKASTLGDSPLPDGTVRLFRRQPTGGLSVIAFVPTKYVPIGQEFEFNLGRDPQVIFERLATRTWRDDFWFTRGDQQKLYSPTKGEKVNENDTVVGWNDHYDRVERIRNYRGAPIDVELRFPIDGDVTFVSALTPTLFDFRTPDFKTTVGAGERKDLAYEIVSRQGTNATQNAVKLEAAK
ncbi:MAG: hypothetical protein JNM94_11545 [Phycisphaerae bacterium]|nr:hypothetical protein [Phycisphaerae bacterium]